MMRDLATASAIHRRLHKRRGDQEPLITSCPLVQIQRVCFFDKNYFRNQYSTIPYPTPAGSVVFAVWKAMNRPSVETTGLDALPPS